MRSHAQRPWALLPTDTKRFVLLIAGAWIGGLVIFLLLGIGLPATSASHGMDRASPSSDLGVMTASYHPADPATGQDAEVPVSPSTISTQLELAGHRWSPSTISTQLELAGHRWLPAAALAPVQLAGHRWLPSAALAPVELAGHRWSPSTISAPVQLAGHRWSPSTATPVAVGPPSRV